MKKNKLNNIIIGNGYIGKFFQNYFNIKNVYTSKNLHEIIYKKFDIIYLAAPSSKKFLANNNKKSDLTNIKNLIKNLDKVDCNKIICISTIDVFDNKHSNENTKIVKKNLLPYGYNRLQLINFIKKKFKNYLIIKLPSLFGNNERKGFFYDLIKFKNIKFYNEKSELQWYYTPFLSKDIKKLKNSKIREINLVSEPISCGSIIKKLNLKRSFNNTSPIIKYNINTKHKYRHIKYSYKKNHILKLMKDYLKN